MVCYEGEIVARELADDTSKSTNGTTQKEEGTVIGGFDFELTTKAFSDPDAPEPVIENFATMVEATTASLEWTSVTIADDSETTVAVYLEGNLLDDDIDSNNYTITDLAPDTEFDGSIVVTSSNEKATAVAFKFSTTAEDENETPSLGDFAIQLIQLEPRLAQISWTRPEEMAGAEIAGYRIFLNDEPLGDTINVDTERIYVLEDLSPETEYFVSVEAFTNNDLTKSSEVIFITATESTLNEPIGDFGPILINNNFPTARLFWSKPETLEEMPVTYTITLDGTALTEDFIGGDSQLIEYFLDDLTPETIYSGTVEARIATGDTRSEDFTFTTLSEVDQNAWYLDTVIINLESNSFAASWIVQNAPDDVTFTYHIILLNEAGEEVTSVIDFNGLNYTFTDLDTGTYFVQIVADASNGSSNEVLLTVDI